MDFVERRAALLVDVRQQGSEFARAYAGLVDDWLRELLGDAPDVALVAVGGYGRGELAPGSDIDVILLHRGTGDVAKIAHRVWYPIWDAGVRLDHSVKTVKDAIAVAGHDLKAALGLVSARTVAGDVEFGADLAARALDQWRRQARRWLPALGDAVKERHSRTGDVAFLLEPDLKESRGGLRDITALRAAARAAPVVPDEDLDRLDSSDALMAARVALHRVTGRASDRLALQDQDRVADALNVAGADELMRTLAAAGRTVGWASDDAWRRIDAWLTGPTGRVARSDRPLSPGVALRDAEIVVTSSADLSDDSLVLRVAAAAAHADAPIARATLERLRAEAVAPGAAWSANARLALVDLLGAGRGTVAAFEALDQYGLLVRILPEWEPVRSHPQHNPYHRFTVDRHLIEAAVEAAALGHRVARPDLLVFAAWLHDLGKAYPGDHTEASVGLVGPIAERLGFSAEDRRTVTELIHHHLLLADMATRRDIRDPATVAKVVDAVGDASTLELLHALTEADGRATGPTAWTAWKEGLVAELVAAVDDRLRGAPPARRDRNLSPVLQPLVDQADGGLLVRAEGSSLVVVAPDRPGLFCQVAGVLALHGLDVLAADIWSAPGVGEGMAVDEFVLQRRPGDDPDWRRFQQDVASALRGSLAIGARLADRARTYGPRGSRATRQPIETSVTIDNEASVDATVVEVRGPDAIGVLFRIARAFVDLQLDIRHAKVLTIGHEIVDTFYVVDTDGQKVEDAVRIAELERAARFEMSQAIS